MEKENSNVRNKIEDSVNPEMSRSEKNEEMTIFEIVKELFREHKKLKKVIIIIFIVAIVWSIANIVFYSIAHNSIYTAIKVYLYDGSSVINKYTVVDIENENYKKGEQLRRDNRSEEALPYFERALEEMKSDYSEDDLRIAQTRMHLGVSYLTVDKLPEAHEQFSNAYVAYKNTLGKNSDNTNEAQMYWAITNQMKGDYDTAINDATEAFERIKYFGTKQEDSYYLCETFNKRGDYDLALEWNDRYLGYIDSIVGKWSNYIFIRKANGLILRGDIFYGARDLDNADDCYKEALTNLEKAEKAPGKEDFTQAIKDLRFRTYQRLSEVKFGQGDDAGGLESLATAMDYHDGTSDNDYDSLYISSVNAYKNNSSEIPGVLLDNLEKTIAINGENNEYTVRQLQILSEYYMREKDYTNALEVNNRALTIQKNLLAEEKPQSLGIYSNLAACNLGLGDFEQAKEWALEGVRVSSNLYGYKTARTKLYATQLVACMNQTKQYEKALTIIEICKLLEIPEAEGSSLPSWNELEGKYISKVNDKNKVNTCIDQAAKLVDSVDDNNFQRIIAETIKQ